MFVKVLSRRCLITSLYLCYGILLCWLELWLGLFFLYYFEIYPEIFEIFYNDILCEYYAVNSRIDAEMVWVLFIQGFSLTYSITKINIMRVSLSSHLGQFTYFSLNAIGY
jgi:hypothetical protein